LALKHIEILHLELVFLVPSDLQSGDILRGDGLDEVVRVEQVINLLVIYLVVAHINEIGSILGLLLVDNTVESPLNTYLDESFVVGRICRSNLTKCVRCANHTRVSLRTFHCVRLPCTSLSICKHCHMVALLGEQSEKLDPVHEHIFRMILLPSGVMIVHFIIANAKLASKK
jgi:hypothetical protein